MRSISSTCGATGAATRVPVAGSMRSVGLPSVLDARVDDAVHDVSQEVAQDHADATDHDRGEHDRIVVRRDTLDPEQAEPGPTEDRLGDRGAAEQRRERQAEQRDEWDQGVAEAVL